jgi:hypothetical protein
MEEIFIGTKIVAAEPMDESDFLRENRVEEWKRYSGVLPVHGYKVRYEDGYISWSPKETFERAYRKMTVKEAEMVAGGQFVIPDSSGSTVKVA